jgi:flagellar biosynthetic protein FliO
MDKLVKLFRNWLETSSQKQKLTAALLVFSVLCTLGLLALKGGSASASDPLESTPLYFIGVFVKMIVVLLLIVASSVIFRRWLQPGIRGKGTRQVQLLETVRLSPKQALHLISVGDRQLLVGATDQGISLITQVEPKRESVEVELATPQPGKDFASLLQSMNMSTKDESSL